MTTIVSQTQLPSTVSNPISGFRHPITPVRRNTWGPLLWTVLHSLGRVLKNVSNGDLRQTLTQDASFLIDILIRSIPCPSCRNHATEHKRRNPIKNAKEKADALEEWAHAFHNDVNRRIQHILIGREDANKLYLTVEPVPILDQYLQSINSHIRIGVNPEEIRQRLGNIIRRV